MELGYRHHMIMQSFLYWITIQTHRKFSKEYGYLWSTTAITAANLSTCPWPQGRPFPWGLVDFFTMLFIQLGISPMKVQNLGWNFTFSKRALLNPIIAKLENEWLSQRCSTLYGREFTQEHTHITVIEALLKQTAWYKL